jgi:hypothetical protein
MLGTTADRSRSSTNALTRFAQCSGPAVAHAAGPARARDPRLPTPCTTDLFAALDVKAGTVIGAYKGQHRAVEFRALLDEVEAAVPCDLDVHLVLDNAATHKTKLIHNWLMKRPRRHLHFTPTSASWLNLVEGWFALLTHRRLQRGVFTSTAALEAAIHAYPDQRRAKTVRLDQVGRWYPGQHRPLLSENFQLRARGPVVLL